MIFRYILTLIVCLALAGCESTRNDFTASVREKFSGPTYQTRTFTGESRAIFDAAQATAQALGFRITRAGAAQGVLEGLSGLTNDDTLRSTRQRTLKVRLTGNSDRSTTVAVLFTEVVEDDFTKGAGQGTETTLRNHPLYDVFFDHLTAALVR
ncbi:MAG TPA: hypothetical protein VIM44_08120 [Rariglobus sp.]